MAASWDRNLKEAGEKGGKNMGKGWKKGGGKKGGGGARRVQGF